MRYLWTDREGGLIDDKCIVTGNWFGGTSAPAPKSKMLGPEVIGGRGQV